MGTSDRTTRKKTMNQSPSNVTITANATENNGKPANAGDYSVKVVCPQSEIQTRLAKVRADAQDAIQNSKGKGLVIEVNTVVDGTRTGYMKLEKDITVKGQRTNNTTKS